MTVVVSTGTLLKVGDGVTPTEGFTNLAQVQEIKWSGYSRKVIEQYTLDALYPERLVGPHDPQNVELKLFFDGSIAAHELFRTKHLSGALGNYQIVMSDAGAYQIAIRGFISKFEVDSFTAEGDPVVATITIEMTALPTVTP